MFLKATQILKLAISFFLIGGIEHSVRAQQIKEWQMGFPEPASPVMERIVSLHDTLLIIIFSIATVVISLILYTIFRFSAKRNPVASKTTHHTWLEVIWTAIPTIIVICIAVPSTKLIYFMDKDPEDAITVKVIGHQWYWSYEMAEHSINFDSRMIEDQDIKPGQIRLLEVDNRLVLPVGKTIRLQLTSDDVLHSWAVPPLGIKKDTVPGRLNQSWVRINKEGTYYGQCSELCGLKHAFMPIVIEAVSPEKYEAWLLEAKQKFAMNPAQVIVASARTLR